jgi:hypothetical protein
MSPKPRVKSLELPFSYFEDDFDTTCPNSWPLVVHTQAHHPLGGFVRCIDAFSEAYRESPLAKQYDQIPRSLWNLEPWIWLTQRSNADLSANKPPYLCRGVKPGEGLTEKNWLGRFHNPILAGSTEVDGIALILFNKPNSDGLIPIVIEISSTSGLNRSMVMDLWNCLGRPYLEVSAERPGWTIMGLVKHPFATISGNGFKIFTTGEYVELSGLGAMGDLTDITDEMSNLNAYRAPQNGPTLPSINMPPRAPEPYSPQREAQLVHKLSYISADCEYPIYRNVVWAILGTGWANREAIARNWCQSAPNRFEEQSFQSIVRGFNPELPNRPTLGTVVHLAKNGGWRG